MIKRNNLSKEDILRELSNVPEKSEVTESKFDTSTNTLYCNEEKPEETISIVEEKDELTLALESFVDKANTIRRK